MPMVTEIFPFYPNYRLGPLDGSTCDTLGLNNEPLADFWWLSDSTLTMEFSDNSFYEPVEWHWDFGDGGISQDTSPAHTFPAAGTYNVCLTVSNQYAADTVCKDVTVGVTGLQDLPVLPRVQVSPNPFGAWLHISLPVLLHEQPRFTLFDVFGKEQASVRLQDFETHLDLPRLPAGVYFWQLRFHGVVTQTGKLIRVE